MKTPFHLGAKLVRALAAEPAMPDLPLAQSGANQPDSELSSTPMSPQVLTETDPNLPLQLTHLRRPATLSWTDAAGPHEVVLTGTMVMGTADGVPLRVTDGRVSRLHAELTLDDAGLWVRDLGSTNGTYVEAVRVDRIRLEQPGRFKVGAVEVAVRFDAPAKVPLWPQDRLGALLGRSDAMRELFMQLTKVASSDASVLIQRDGHRQGAGRPGAPRSVATVAKALRGGGLRVAAREPARGRALRARTRRLHGRGGGANWLHRSR